MTTRPALRPLVAAAVLGAALAAAGPASPALASPVSACPTVGRTLARASNPTVRVYRTGASLRACVAPRGQRRVVRLLDTWSSSTKVAVASGSVAWTTRRTVGGLPVDAVTTEVVRTGRTWLRAEDAAPSPDSATPAAADRVLRVVTDGRATGWVTASGVVAAAVRRIDLSSTTLYGAGVPGTVPYRSDHTFFLRQAGPAHAAAVARRLRFALGGDGDECGGTVDHQLLVPGWDTQPPLIFVYASVPWEAKGPCG